MFYEDRILSSICNTKKVTSEITVLLNAVAILQCSHTPSFSSWHLNRGIFFYNDCFAMNAIGSSKKLKRKEQVL